MDETYSDIATKIHKKNMAPIRMTDIYSTSSFGSKQVRDYLKSFSQTTLDVKDSLECAYHMKQKSAKKGRLYRSIKPYFRDKINDKPTKSISLTNKLMSSQRYNRSSLENEIKKEMKNTVNTKSLTVNFLDGARTEVTLKPIVLVHVREIPAPAEANKEIYRLASPTLPHSLCQQRIDAKFAPHKLDSQLQINRGSQNHSNINILRVKSSHNCTDLSSERKLSCMKTNNAIGITQGFKVPLCQLDRRCVIENMSSINLETSPSVCYYSHDTKPSCRDKDVIGVPPCEYTKHDRSYENFSVTTFFRYPVPIPSNTSEYMQGFSPKLSDMNRR